MQYKHAQLILDLFSVSLDWRHRPNNNKYTTRLMTAMGAWIQRLSYSSSSFFISCISVICSYRTFPNLIIIYMCIPELFYNILLLCVNIRLFRSVKNRSSPDLIDTQSCTGSWTLVVQKNMKCSIGFLKISPVHCKLLRHGENKPNKACDWLFRTHLPASLLRLTFLFLRCDATSPLFRNQDSDNTENKTEIKIQMNTIQLSFKNRCSYNDLNRRSQPAVFS